MWSDLENRSLITTLRYVQDSTLSSGTLSAEIWIDRTLLRRKLLSMSKKVDFLTFRVSLFARNNLHICPKSALILRCSPRQICHPHCHAMRCKFTLSPRRLMSLCGSSSEEKLRWLQFCFILEITHSSLTPYSIFLNKNVN